MIFLRREFNNVEFTSDLIDPFVADVLKGRIKEIENCYPAGAYLSVIFLAGSTLEGFCWVLLRNIQNCSIQQNHRLKIRVGK